MLKNSKAFSGYSVDDLAKAKEFYTKTLGLETKDNPMGMLEFQFAGGTSVMIYPKENHRAAHLYGVEFPCKGH